MIKINANVKRYFDNLKKVNRFYFTSDGLAFFNEDLANVHAANLKKNKKPDIVTLITRDEVNAWAATVSSEQGQVAAKADADGQLAAAKAGLADAEAALTAAEAAQNTVNANTSATSTQKTAATKALNKATADVANANAAVTAAQALVDGLAKGTN